MNPILIKDIIKYLEDYKCLNISKQFKSQIIKYERKLPFYIFNEFFNKCNNENANYNYITMYKQYLYDYEEYQYEKKERLI